MITLRQLQCFVSVVKTGGFYQASLQLHLTQPSVTKAVSNLEDRLGGKLFIKPISSRKREIELTEIGQLVYSQAITVLRQVDDIEQSVVAYLHMTHGKLRLGVSPLGSELLTHSIFAFYKQYPNVQLTLVEKGAESLKSALLDNKLDVATLMQPIGEEFDHVSLCNYPVLVVASSEQIVKNSQTVSLRSLYNASFVLMANDSSFTSLIINECQKVGFEPNIICHTNQFELLLNLVKRNMGLALLPSYYQQRLEQNGLICLPLAEPKLQWQLVMAWRKHRPLSPTMVAWLDILDKHFS